MMNKQIQLRPTNSLAEYAGLSWAFSLPTETAEEFDAFSAWIVAIDLSPVAVALEHGVDPSAVYRNLWVARMKEYREFARYIQIENALDMQVQQLGVLRAQMQHYERQITDDKQRVEAMENGGIESTAKAIEILQERIERQTKAYYKLVQLTGQITKAITPATPLVQVNTAQINNAGQPQSTDPLSKLRHQLGPNGVTDIAIDAEVTVLEPPDSE